MNTIYVPRGDEGFKLEFTITDSAGDAVDLTLYDSVNLKMWLPGSPSTLYLDAACSNLADDGTCDYTLAETDFTGAEYPPCDRYYAELELIAGSTVESTETFAIIIEESG